VTDGGSATFLWTFSGPVTLTGSSVPQLETFDGDSSTWKPPDSVATTSANSLTGTYPNTFSLGTGWRVLTTPTAIAPTVTTPESGVTT
jgi:hypothetical protein